MAIHIKAYALAGTYETYCDGAGTFVLARAEAARKAHEPVLYRRLTHLPARLGADQVLLAATMAQGILPPHHESCVMYVRIFQDGWRKDRFSGFCFQYEPPATAGPFVAVRERP